MLLPKEIAQAQTWAAVRPTSNEARSGPGKSGKMRDQNQCPRLHERTCSIQAR
jgi:hypothetical protein